MNQSDNTVEGRKDIKPLGLSDKNHRLVYRKPIFYVAIGLIMIKMKNNSKKRLLILCECAITIALALALEPLELDFAWLQGGGIDVLMVPLVILAMRRGGFWGMATGAVFGLLKSIVWGGFEWGPVSVIMDYVLAYAAVGVAGFFKKPWWAVLAATAARFAVHFVSGVTIYAIVASETVYGITTASPFVYSLVYNAPYVLINGIICFALVMLLQKPVSKLPK